MQKSPPQGRTSGCVREHFRNDKKNPVNHSEHYPLVICYIAIENGHRNSGFTRYKIVDLSIVFCMFTEGISLFVWWSKPIFKVRYGTMINQFNISHILTIPATLILAFKGNIGSGNLQPSACVYLYIYIWLVVYLPLWKIWVRQWEGLCHILWKIKNVPNHQPGIYIYPICLNLPIFGESNWNTTSNILKIILNPQNNTNTQHILSRTLADCILRLFRWAMAGQSRD